MAKIGAELPKLSQKIKLGIRFLDHPVWRLTLKLMIAESRADCHSTVYELSFAIRAVDIFLFASMKARNSRDLPDLFAFRLVSLPRGAM